MKMMFPKHRNSFVKTEAKTALHALSEIHKTGKFSKVIMIVGSDRVREFDNLLNKYNEVESKHGYYRFKDIDVISAGERDPDAEGATGMSASKMRAAVKEETMIFSKWEFLLVYPKKIVIHFIVQSQKE